ncbi:homoserine kinase [Haliangium sp.]|uniref:homoserine kinase n=1 Tax=Haliangium sp. TaxID=2663208 RepID=UPI003D118865
MWHRAFAPATVANLGPGFDVLGLALDPALGVGDTCEVQLTDGDQVSIEITGDGGRLPTAPDDNCASVVARAVLERTGRRAGLEIKLHKGLPLASGLGSSAASSAAAALATNLALGAPLSRRELVECARLGEAVAAGTPHPDNVAPALLGGLLLMVERPCGLHIAPLPVPEPLRVAVVMPALEVRSSDARAVLPAAIPMADVVANLGSIGLFVSALYEGDLDRLSEACHDRLHQPYRIPLVRGYDQARQAALDAGAVGMGLSGSGPSMFALTDGDERAQAAGEAMVQAFAGLDIAARAVHGRIAASFDD